MEQSLDKNIEQTAPALSAQPRAQAQPAAQEQPVPQAQPARPVPPPPIKRNKRKKWPFLVLGLVVVALAVWVLLRQSPAKAQAQSAYTLIHAEERGIVKKLSGSGTLKPANAYTVTTLIEGNILTADFEEGDIVEKDTVLYEMDSSTAANNIEQAERSLEQAELNLAQAQRSLGQSQRSYNDAADTQYVRAPGSGTLIELNVRIGDQLRAGQTVGTIRDSAVMYVKVPFPSDDALSFWVGQDAAVILDNSFETLYGTVKEISAADIVGIGNMLMRNVTVEVVNPGALTDGQAASVSIGGVNGAGNANFTYRAESTVTVGVSGTVTDIWTPEGSAVTKDQTILVLGGDLSDTIRSAADGVQNSAGGVRNAELSVENARIALENAKKRMDDYTIRSPISGTVVEKVYKAGDKVSAAKAMCTIYDLSYLEMTLNIDELDISAVRVGQTVRVTAEAVEGAEYTGTVTRVSVAGNTANGTTSYPVTIRLDETEGLLPGMNADAQIVVSSADDALSIPNAAVNRRKLVLITADSPSAAHPAPAEAPAGYAYVQVETGISDDDYVQILSGLTAEDTVAYIPPAVVSMNPLLALMGGAEMEEGPGDGDGGPRG